MAHHPAPAHIIFPIATKRDHSFLQERAPAFGWRFALATNAKRSGHNQPLFSARDSDIEQAFMFLQLAGLLHLNDALQPSGLLCFANGQ